MGFTLIDEITNLKDRLSLLEDKTKKHKGRRINLILKKEIRNLKKEYDGEIKNQKEYYDNEIKNLREEISELKKKLKTFRFAFLIKNSGIIL